METKISRWGNSLAVRIPKHLAEAAGLAEGDHLDMEAEGQELKFRKRQGVTRYDLDELMAQVTEENSHELVDWGGPVGREVW